jgi:hypothetical protein
MHLVDLATGRQLAALTTAPEVSLFRQAAFSPDGRTLAAVSDTHGRGPGDQTSIVYAFHLWEVASGQEFLRAELKDRLTSAFAFSPDGRLVATAGPQGVRLWDVASFQEVLHHDGHESRVNALAFSPDGTRLAAAQGDTTALVWDVASARAHAASPGKRLNARNLDLLWDELAGNAPRAHRAVWALAAAPAQAASLLTERLQPVPETDLRRIAQLIADLNSNQFADRSRATKELERLGEAAEPALHQALAGKPTLEVRQRIEAILAGVPVMRDAESLRRLRALQVLEQVGMPAAGPALDKLARGAPAARETREARAVLERLARRPDAGSP